jgi:5-methylcytosine-specific restriction endonuclease McrA
VRPFYGLDLCRFHYDRERRVRLHDEIRRYARRYAAENAEASRLRGHNRRARQKGADGVHTAAEWRDKLAAFNGRCAYCGGAGDTKDHVVPLTRGGTNYIDNIVPACRSCNSSKGRKTLEEWIATFEEVDDGEVAEDDCGAAQPDEVFVVRAAEQA